jgi:cytidine deaminase
MMRWNPMAHDPSSLLEAAARARGGAYAPYSNFTVGAALQADDGRVFVGANIENASYGLSMCAERVAFFTAVTAGVRAFEALAVVGPEGTETTPCGACRQVLVEFGAGLNVITASAAGPVMRTIGELLPDAFSPRTLEDAR